MSLKKATADALAFLYSEYKKEGNPGGVISPYAVENGIDEGELGTHLRDRGWAKEVRLMPRNVWGEITIMGINQVDPYVIPAKEIDVIEGLGKAGGRGNLTDIWDHDIGQFGFSLALANYFQDSGLIRIEASFFAENQIVAVLSVRGKEEFQNSPVFFNG